jgi:hypothetical protein
MAIFPILIQVPVEMRIQKKKKKNPMYVNSEKGYETLVEECVD